jgi:hypothetical protein
MTQEEAGDGTGKTGQEFAIGATIETVVGLLDDLLGGDALLLGGGGAADADQPG